MLEVKDLCVSYGAIPVLHDVSFNVRENEIVTLLGSNGTGKSTILNTIQGLMKPTSGSIAFQNKSITKLPPHRVVKMGIAQVPEGSRNFPYLTVKENLLLGAYPSSSWRNRRASLEYVFDLFPILKERINMAARLMSGGEQQMLKIGKGLMATPKLIMIDEPSVGLAPLIVDALYETMEKLRGSGITILLTEQNALRALQLADRGYILKEGRVVLEDTSENLIKSDLVKKAYLGR